MSPGSAPTASKPFAPPSSENIRSENIRTIPASAKLRTPVRLSKKTSTAFFDNKVPRPRERPMETGATLCASVDRQRRPIRRSRRRRKLHIPRSRLKPRAQSFRCSSSPNECESHSLGTRSIFGDVHAAAENDCSPFRAHRARNSARLFNKMTGVRSFADAGLFISLSRGARRGL